MSESIVQKILRSFERKIFSLEDYFFEKYYNLELGGIITQDKLIIEGDKNKNHATVYQAVWCRNLRELFEEAKKYGCKFDNFIDVGCGKGKACFYAYTTGDFKKIVGIDFSKPLIEIAENNQEEFVTNIINFINCDASEYIIPEQSHFIFMFNPFDEIILKKFISNNLSNIKKHKSLVAYANDIHRKTLEDLGFEPVFRNSKFNLSLYRII